MQLRKVEIRHFRSIKSLDITFERNFQVLVGINEAGKSNVLKALSLLNKTVEITKNDIRDPGHDEDAVTESYVKFIFKLDKRLVAKVFQSVKERFLSTSLTSLLDIGEKHYSLEDFCKYKNEAIYKVDVMNASRTVLHWRREGPQYRVHPTWKKVKEGTNIQITHQGVAKSLSAYSVVNINEVKDIPAQYLEDLNMPSLNSIVGECVINIATDNLPPCIVWNYIEDNLLPNRISLSQFTSQPAICVPLKNMFSLAGYRDVTKALQDASQKINGITNILRKVSENTTAHMRKVWPEWKKQRVILSQNGEYIDAGIEDEFNVYSLARRSDGFKRFFTFLLMISVQNVTEDIRNNIIIIDEPDIGLHPSGIQYLRQELEKIGQNNLILVSSHSIFMIDKEIIDRHLIVEKKNEITELKRVTSSNITDEEVIFKALGYSLFDLLKPKNIIFEGWRDKKYFQLFISSHEGRKMLSKARESHLGFLHAMGAKDISRVANICENFAREYVIVSDADKPSKDAKKRFDGQGKWFCYDDIDNIDVITTEDFVSNKAINKALRASFSVYDIEKVITLPDDLTRGKLDFIQKELETHNVGPTLISPLMDHIKGQICSNLKSSDLAESYMKACSRIFDHIFE
jgi:AAA15 family ATPase/GTPase